VIGIVFGAETSPGLCFVYGAETLLTLKDLSNSHTEDLQSDTDDLWTKIRVFSVVFVIFALKKERMVVSGANL
jgi:hypothetical protein